MTGLVLLGALVLAEPTSDSAGAMSPEAITALIEQAANQYDQGLFDDSLQTLERAYRSSQRPSILYNIGQVQRARGDCNAALAAFQGFIAQADTADPMRDRASRWALEMQACIERAGAKEKSHADSNAIVLPRPAPRPAAPPPPSVVAAPVAASPAPSSRALRWTGWGLVAAGAVLEVTAILLQSQASSIAADLRASPPDDPIEWKRRNNEGLRDARWSLLSAVAGGVMGGAGATILIVGRPWGGDPSRVALLGWAGTF